MVSFAVTSATFLGFEFMGIFSIAHERLNMNRFFVLHVVVLHVIIIVMIDFSIYHGTWA